MDKYRELIETNNWLLAQCKEAANMKHKLGYEALQRNQLMKNMNKTPQPTKKKNPLSNKNKVKPGDKKKEDGEKKKPSNILSDKRKGFAARRCVTYDKAKPIEEEEKTAGKSNFGSKMSSEVPSKSSEFSNDFPEPLKKEELSRFGKNAAKKSRFSKPNENTQAPKSNATDDYQPRRKSGGDSRNSNLSPDFITFTTDLNLNNNAVESVPGREISGDRAIQRGDSPSTIEETIKDKIKGIKNSDGEGEEEQKPNNHPGELPHKLLRQSQSQKYSHFKTYKDTVRGNSQDDAEMQQKSKSKSSKSEDEEEGDCFADGLFSSSEEEEGSEENSTPVVEEPIQTSKPVEKQIMEDFLQRSESSQSQKQSQFAPQQSQEPTPGQSGSEDELGFAVLGVNDEDLQEPANDFDDLFSSDGSLESEEEEQENIFDVEERENDSEYESEDEQAKKQESSSASNRDASQKSKKSRFSQENTSGLVRENTLDGKLFTDKQIPELQPANTLDELGTDQSQDLNESEIIIEKEAVPEVVVDKRKLVKKPSLLDKLVDSIQQDVPEEKTTESKSILKKNIGGSFMSLLKSQGSSSIKNKIKQRKMENEQKKKQRSRMNSARSSPGDPEDFSNSEQTDGGANPSTGLIENKTFTFGQEEISSAKDKIETIKEEKSPDKRKISNSSGSQSPTKRRNRALSRSNLGAMFATSSDKNIVVTKKKTSVSPPPTRSQKVTQEAPATTTSTVTKKQPMRGGANNKRNAFLKKSKQASTLTQYEKPKKEPDQFKEARNITNTDDFQDMLNAYKYSKIFFAEIAK